MPCRGGLSQKDMNMENEKEEKNKTGEDSRECFPGVDEACASPNLEEMTPEEKKAYLDDLFFDDLFREG